MKRSFTFAVVVLVASLFVGSAFKAQAATTASPAAASAPSADDTSNEGGYWAAWAEAASH